MVCIIICLQEFNDSFPIESDEFWFVNVASEDDWDNPFLSSTIKWILF